MPPASDDIGDLPPSRPGTRRLPSNSQPVSPIVSQEAVVDPGSTRESPLQAPADDGVASPRAASSSTFIFPIRSVYNIRSAGQPGASVTPTSVTPTSPTLGARGGELPRSSSANDDDLRSDPSSSVPQSLFDMLDTVSAHGASGGVASTATLSRRPLQSQNPSTPTGNANAGILASPPLPPSSGEDPAVPPRAETQLEPDGDGVTNLINDFSGIIRLGDAAPGGTTAAGSSTVLPPATAGVVKAPLQAKKPGHASIGRLVQKGTHTSSASMRAQTRDSVRDFVNEQAHTVQVSDPNAAAPSPAPETADVSSIGSPVSTLRSASDSASLSSGGSNNIYTPQPLTGRSKWTAYGDASSDDGPSHAPSPSVSDGLQDISDRCSAEGVLAPDEPFTTVRFQHLTTEEGHHVVVGRGGSLQRCEDEPITIPGAVQGFGVLILLEENYETGDMTVRQVSENSTELLGLSPQYLFRLPCFSRIFSGDQEDVLRDNIESLPYPEDDTTPEMAADCEGPQVFRLTGYGEPGSEDTCDEDMSGSTPSQSCREWTCWVAASRPKMDSWVKYDDNGQALPVPDLVILEFELERDNYNPLVQPLDAYTQSGTLSPGSSEYRSLAGSNRINPGTWSSSRGSASRGSRVLQEQPGSVPSLDTRFGTQPSGSSTMQTDSEIPSASTVPTSAQHGTGSILSGSSSSAPRVGLDGHEVEPPLERVLESTTNYAKPLRSLTGMRRTGMDQWSDPEGRSGSCSKSRGTGGSSSHGSRGSSRRQRRRRGSPSSSDALDVVAVLNQINEQLGRAKDLDSFLKITVGLVKDLCRFHRVVIYQFDEEYNGKVVTELVDWSTTTDLWKGLMFPAADIPPQARELYRINKVRFLYDRSQMTARLVLRDKSDLDHPLDMTHCFLRAMSPIHLKYLANMHVRSSMSISIMAFGKLWGLIACHSYGNHGMRVAFPVRQMLRILSDVVSRNLERLRYAQRLRTRQLINTTGFGGLPGLGQPRPRRPSVGQEADPHSSQGYIVSNADELLNIFDADSGLLVINDGCKLLGQCDQAHAMLAIAEYLRIAKFDDIVASNHITHDFPDLILPRATDTIAGLLYVPLTSEAGQDFIVFLRKGQVDEVRWAGRPYINEDAENKAVLEPRKSFKLWVEKVTGRSRQWTDDQLDSARVLSLIYGKFIHVWREKQNAMMSNQLTAILLSNTSHAVRTPLSQIINTLELALAGNIDKDTRNMLENSHQASRALLFHVHDLLDLTRIETGNETAFNDPFDLKQTIGNTVRLYQTETHRRGIGFTVTMADDLPPMVIGDSRKVKTVVSNLVANAVKYTREGSIEVTCRLEPGAEHQLSSASIEIIVSDTGCGIPPEKLEAMFVTLEGAEDRAEGGGVGLGLAVVARIVEQLQGQLRAESEVNKGTTFYFTCTMGVNADFHRMNGGTSTGASTGASVGASASGEQGDGTTSPVSSLKLQPSSTTAKASLDHTKITKAREGSATPQTRSEPGAPVSPSAAVATEVKTPGTATTASTTTIPATKPPRDKLGPKGKPQLRILVVEDDVINSQILQKRLKMDKHTVRAVENGQQAVDLIASDWDFDAIVMDIQMPIMDGFEAAREIRRLEQVTPPPKDIDPVRVDGQMPIFALSASLYEDDRVHLGAHFDGWLLKPLDFNRLRALLGALLDSDKRAAEIYRQGQWERGGYFRGGPEAMAWRRRRAEESNLSS